MSDMEFCNLAYDGRVAMLKASLEKDGGLVRRRDANKRTALHWACSSGRNEVVGVLLSKGAEVQIKFTRPPTSLQMFQPLQGRVSRFLVRHHIPLCVYLASLHEVTDNPTHAI